MKPQELRDSLPQEFRARVESIFQARGVRASIALAGLAACGYVRNTELCPDRQAYTHQIADGVFGTPTMGWNAARPETQIALDILAEERVFVKQPNKTDRLAPEEAAG